MTAKDFINLRNHYNKVIENANENINRAREKVKVPALHKLRLAEAKDIVEGAVIYYPKLATDSEDRHPHWQIISEVRYPNDAFKAYVSEDGCRYGLDRAYVEKE